MPNQVVFRRPYRKRGQNWPGYFSRPLNKGDITGSGGVLIGGAASVAFGHAGQVASDVVVEWDFDNDGDFSDSVEEITSFVLGMETFTGRDWPSLLTGKAGPGKFRGTLRNDDDRFSYFNAASPLVTSPFSLRTGRKIRVRTSDADNPDPTPIAKDRFRDTQGPLTDDEFGNTYVQPLTDDFTRFALRAVAVTEGAEHMALIDSGMTDYYVQTKISVLGAASPDNRVGVVYRYVDTDDYSLCVINGTSRAVQLIDVISGVESVQFSSALETYSGVTIGVHVVDSVATAYVEGVSIGSVAAINASAELVGFYADWFTGDTRPEIDEFFAWSGLPTTEEGILWTGELADLASSVSPGPEKLAAVSAEGRLSKLSSQDITPPASVSGRRTGLLAGNALSKALQLHPPGQVDLGVVTTGVFVMEERSALAVLRDVEETEFGFLFETQEGHLSFLDRDHRDLLVSAVTFTDDPAGQFHYHQIEPYNAQKEVFNRVSAGVSPWTEGEASVLFTDPGPYVLSSGQTAQIQATYDGVVSRWAGHTRDVTPATSAPSGITRTTQSSSGTAAFGVTMPATVDAGDLLLIVAATNKGTWDEEDVPAGWTVVGIPDLINPVIIAKVAVGDEDSDTITLNAFGAESDTVWAAHVFRVTDWYGIIDGVEATDVDQAVGTTPNPPEITPTWGAVPTLFIAAHHDFVATGVTQSAVPSGYGNGAYTVSAFGSNDIGLGTAWRTTTTADEDPGTFTISASKTWTGYTLAIRGPGATTPVAGSTPIGDEPTFVISYDDDLGGTTQTHTNIEVTGVPLVEGDQTFAQVDDYDSQDDHNAIRTYQNSANLFANPTDAETYANLVLAAYADDRPILSMSFYASKSPAYRAQAVRRRVGDRITLIADSNAGLGISQDFYIESIGHRWSNGTKLWEVTWELSPVPA